MFKKFIAFLLACMLAFSFAGCMKEQSSADETQPAMNADNADVQPPDKDSKELFVFKGGYISDRSGFTDVRYGLMTLDGEIVAEPVYTHYRRMSCGDTEYYCMKYIEHELYEGGEFYCESTLIKTDGSWMLKLDNEIDSINEDRIVTSKYGSEYAVYDYEGNVIFKGEGKSSVSQEGYNNGILLTYDNCEDEQKDVIAYDKDGNEIFGGLASCMPFYTDKAVASLDDNGYGIISVSGEWLFEPVYEDILFNVNSKEFYVNEGDICKVYDSSLNLLRTEPIKSTYEADASRKEYIGDNEEYYKYYSDKPDSYVHKASDDQLIVCKSNSLPATEIVRSDGEKTLFSAVDENNTLWVFDIEGEVFAEYKNTQAMGFAADDFYWLSNGGTVDYFDAKTNRKIFSAYSDDEKLTKVDLLSDECDYLCVAELGDYHTSQYNDVRYHLYNYKKGEYVFKDCEICTIEEFEGKIFITVIDEDYATVYDENLNALLTVKNACQGMTYEGEE